MIEWRTRKDVVAGESMSWRQPKYDVRGYYTRSVVYWRKEVSRAFERGWTACNLDATLLSVFHVKVAICGDNKDRHRNSLQ